MTLSINDTQNKCHSAKWHNADSHYAECRNLRIVMLNGIMQSVTIYVLLCLMYAECRYAECRHAECRYAERHYAKCRYAECRGAMKTFKMPKTNMSIKLWPM